MVVDQCRHFVQEKGFEIDGAYPFFQSSCAMRYYAQYFVYEDMVRGDFAVPLLNKFLQHDGDDGVELKIHLI